jgi:hypothetical protein
MSETEHPEPAVAESSPEESAPPSQPARARRTPEAATRQSTQPAPQPPEESAAESPPQTPRDPAEFEGVAGVYVYEGEETTHPRIGQLVPGENDFSGVTHPEMLQAIQEYAQQSPEVFHKS